MLGVLMIGGRWVQIYNFVFLSSSLGGSMLMPVSIFLT
jgi:hypothetical protein